MNKNDRDLVGVIGLQQIEPGSFPVACRAQHRLNTQEKWIWVITIGRSKISCERPLGAIHPDGLSFARIIEGKGCIESRIAISAADRIEVDGSGNQNCQALWG